MDEMARLHRGLDGRDGDEQEGLPPVVIYRCEIWTIKKAKH